MPAIDHGELGLAAKTTDAAFADHLGDVPPSVVARRSHPRSPPGLQRVAPLLAHLGGRCRRGDTAGVIVRAHGNRVFTFGDLAALVGEWIVLRGVDGVFATY